MAITQNSYRIVCERLSSHQLPNTLRHHFANEINSPRRLASLRTIGDLIDILERRAVLSPEEPQYLEYITLQTNTNSLWQNALSNQNFQQHPAENPMRNGELPQNVAGNPEVEAANDHHIPHRLHHLRSRVIPPVPNDPVRRVHRIIVDGIGQKWRDLARELEVPEGTIDKLERSYPFDFDKWVNEVLEYHLESCSKHQWRNNLQNALRAARRLDLSNKVAEILSNAGIS